MRQQLTLTSFLLLTATGCANNTGGVPIVDTTAPTVESTAPLAEGIGLDAKAPITATFSEPIDERTVNKTTFRVYEGADPIAGTVSLTGQVAQFTPKAPLAVATDLTATLSIGVTDLAGNHLAADHTWRFKIAPVDHQTSPVVVATIPLYGKLDGSPDAVLRLKAGEAMAVACVDTDADGVCDANDRCPTVSGPATTHGCQVDPCTGSPIAAVVLFDPESSAMPAPNTGTVKTMDPVLDAVAAAIAKDPACRVCIVGHASKDGPGDQNLILSTERALEVQAYLVGHGLDKSRIPALGVGERCPIVPANTLLANRRVEFRRLHEGDGCPEDCAVVAATP